MERSHHFGLLPGSSWQFCLAALPLAFVLQALNFPQEGFCFRAFGADFLGHVGKDVGAYAEFVGAGVDGIPPLGLVSDEIELPLWADEAVGDERVGRPGDLEVLLGVSDEYFSSHGLLVLVCCFEIFNSLRG